MACANRDVVIAWMIVPFQEIVVDSESALGTYLYMEILVGVAKRVNGYW
jgi:hypothetical protein